MTLQEVPAQGRNDVVGGSGAGAGMTATFYRDDDYASSSSGMASRWMDLP